MRTISFTTTPDETPARAAGVTKRLWKMKDIVEVPEAWEAAN
jgi:hypothetical protein